MIYTDDITKSRAQRILHKVNEVLDEHVCACDQCLLYEQVVDCCGVGTREKPCLEGAWLDQLRTKWYRTVEFFQRISESRLN